MPRSQTGVKDEKIRTHVRTFFSTAIVATWTQQASRMQLQTTAETRAMTAGDVGDDAGSDGIGAARVNVAL